MSRPPVDYIDVTRRTYDSLGYPPYRWVHSEGAIPWTRPKRPLSECRVGFDTQIAALCLERGARRLLTLDRDFRRFSRLELVALED